MKTIVSKIMKAKRILNFMAVLSLGVFTSCVEDDDFQIPVLEFEEPNIQANTSISIVKSMYAGGLVDFTEASNGGELIIEGYVVSNDEAGNFFKVLVIQDAPENPTAAIQIDVDVTSLYSKYKPGRKIFVKLNGLGMDEVNGVLHIGSIQGSTVARISATNYEDFIMRSSEIATLIPTVITPAQYNDNYINMLVQIDDMQIVSAENGLPYANADDTFSVNRNLKNCNDNSTTIIRNSGFADFKNQLFPTGRGSIVAVFSKFNSTYQLYIRDTNDISFDGMRCDPLFEDSFSQGNLNKWTPYNVTGAQVWYYNTFGNPSDSATMSGFSGSSQTNEDWLISKPIDLSGVSGAILKFQSVKRFAGNNLELYMSTNYGGGNPNVDGIWTPLSATFDTNINSWTSWTDSGPVDVSAAAGGNLFIAFKYTSTTSAASTYEIDNVEVVAQ